MSINNFSPSVRRSPFGQFFNLHVERGDKGTAYPVSDDACQKLVDQLWELGIKPSEATKTIARMEREFDASSTAKAMDELVTDAEYEQRRFDRLKAYAENLEGVVRMLLDPVKVK